MQPQSCNFSAAPSGLESVFCAQQCPSQSSLSSPRWPLRNCRNWPRPPCKNGASVRAFFARNCLPRKNDCQRQLSLCSANFGQIFETVRALRAKMVPQFVLFARALRAKNGASVRAFCARPPCKNGASVRAFCARPQFVQKKMVPQFVLFVARPSCSVLVQELADAPSKHSILSKNTSDCFFFFSLASGQRRPSTRSSRIARIATRRSKTAFERHRRRLRGKRPEVCPPEASQQLFPLQPSGG